jgi:hypothetical protein
MSGEQPAPVRALVQPKKNPVTSGFAVPLVTGRQQGESVDVAACRPGGA